MREVDEGERGGGGRERQAERRVRWSGRGGERRREKRGGEGREVEEEDRGEGTLDLDVVAELSQTSTTSSHTRVDPRV